ncbi:hydantoinase/oxoprolinase family protein, partial [Aquifex sp.]
KISIERGYNPGEFALLSFGGAGGLHAVFLAKSLNIPKVIIPVNPGILSAIGMLMSDVVKDVSTTVMLKESEATPHTLEELFKTLEEKLLREMEKEGFSEDNVLLERFMDLRYKGQSYELIIPYSEDFRESFEREHERLYGYRHEGREIEIVNIRLRAVGLKEKPSLKELEFSEKLKPEAILGEREVYIEGEWKKFKVIDREKLTYGNKIDFPAIVVEYSSTTLIPEGVVGEVDRYGNLILNLS